MEAPHTDANQLEWSNEQIARFWDYWSTRDDAQDTYFALQVGAGVSRFASFATPLQGRRVLDFGAGPGHLTKHLLEQGAIVNATDPSPQSVSEADQRFANFEGWEGAREIENGRAPWPNASFDVVFCLETIEHLHTNQCTEVFDEIHRLLRPSGLAIFTTPHREDLQRSHVYCPCCNTEFHRWQHLRSWTDEALHDQLTQHGYEVDFCEGLNFHDFQPPTRRRHRLSSLRRAVRRLALEQLDKMLPRAFPHQRTLQRLIQKSDRHHLAAVARKPQSMATPHTSESLQPAA